MIGSGRSFVVLCLLLAACAPASTASIDYAHPEQKIAAVNLVSNYINHPNVADRDHTRKVMEVTGRMLRTEPGHVVVGSAEKGEVWLAFEGGTIPPGLTPGQEITVVGQCKGMDSELDPKGNGHVLVDQCRLMPKS